MDLYVIYENPLDFPGQFMVRRWEVQPGNPQPVPDLEAVTVCHTLMEAREAIPPGRVQIPRSREDNAAIVETWL